MIDIFPEPDFWVFSVGLYVMGFMVLLRVGGDSSFPRVGKEILHDSVLWSPGVGAPLEAGCLHTLYLLSFVWMVVHLTCPNLKAAPSMWCHVKAYSFPFIFTSSEMNPPSPVFLLPS